MAGVDPEASSRIFISYRREDSRGYVHALLPPLRRHFGSDRIFRDIDNIPPGSYTLVAWNEGTASEPRAFTINDGGTTEVDFSLR